MRAVERSHQGVADLVARNQEFLDELTVISKRLAPEFMENSESLFAKRGRTVENFLKYYFQMLQLYRDATLLNQAVDLGQELRAARSQQRSDHINIICKERGITEEIHEALIDRWQGKEPLAGLRNLKYLSLVITKTDRFPSVYPPTDYAKFQLPTSWLHLKTLTAYLVLLGGMVRYYNATSLGYSIQHGSSFLPGPGNSFTPVNIVEPVFDMLLADSNDSA